MRRKPTSENQDQDPGAGGAGAERTALAALRSGCSFDQAAAVSGLSVQRVAEVWRQFDRKADP